MGGDYYNQIDYLMIEVNSDCNLNCRFCNRKDLVAQGLRPFKHLTVNEFTQMLNSLNGTRIDTIKLEGLSEPMLHPQFDRMAELLRVRFPHAFVIIATNLQYELSKSRFLATLPFVDMVYLSIDGTGPTYEAARLGARYDRLLRSLDQIKNLVPAQWRSQKLHINFTASPENVHTLDDIYKLKEIYGLASVRINLAQNWNEEQKNALVFDQEFIAKLKPFREDVKGVAPWDYKDCFWPFHGTIIDAFGDVRVCIINTSTEPIGNIFENPLNEIFDKNPVINNVRQKLRQNQAHNHCVNCDYKGLSIVLQKVFEGRKTLSLPRPVRQLRDENHVQ
ncbi:MAG: SPASM domain-containing protein [Oligoflexia bacterium]|nr:SPASM domain-containing protein [Oligoflexia bacterium]